MKRSELKEFGPWSEQYSSSGKKYYYNRDSEVSQWEKPPEWRQAEKEHERSKQHKNTASASNEKTERVKAKPCSTHEEHYHYHRSNSNFCSEKEKEKSYSTSKAERRRVSSSVTPDANLIEKGKSPIFHPPAKRSCIGESPTTASKISRSEARRRSIDKSEERKLQSSHSNNSVKLEPHTSDKNVSPSATMPEKFIKSEECREPAPFLFQEEKYAQFYSTELSVYKKNLASEHYLNEAKKHAEKSAKLRATMSSIEIDINSIRSLIRIEELRATNLKKRLKFIREEISSLEEQNR